jgi:hypothetical protein
MYSQIRKLRDATQTLTPDAFRRILALAVLVLFVAVCLGRLLAPQVVLFGELLPFVSGLLVVVVRSYFGGRERA